MKKDIEYDEIKEQLLKLEKNIKTPKDKAIYNKLLEKIKEKPKIICYL